MGRPDRTQLAERYATEKAGEWVYDGDGYCPFTRVRLEGVICRSYSDGADSTMSKGRLTAGQREAIVDALGEYLVMLKESSSAKGTPSREAVAKIRILERVKDKLATEKEESNV